MSSSQPQKRITLGDIEYSINEEDKTASVTKYKGETTEIIIPCSIKHESKEYIVTIVGSGAFFRSSVKSISFEPKSELRTIEKCAFSLSRLARIQIPAGAVELEDGWCRETRNLTEVEVDRGNARYSSVGGKLIIGKSDIAKEDYDTLVFCARDSTEVNIPATIKTICTYAFSDSRLASIQIPSHVTQICAGAFLSCRQLSRFEFEPNSELQTIGKYAFSYSRLARIQIPAGVVELEDGWCRATRNLTEVEVDRGNARYSSVGGKLIIGKSDIAKEDYDILVFCARDSTEVNIPATIKIIGAHAFSYSAITSIQIPSHVTQICENAFYGCKQLSRFEFEPNSELQTIGKYAFSYSRLASIQIPSHVTQICEGAFYGCEQLSRVEFEQNSELKTIGEEAFSHSAFASIQIPSPVTQICEHAFYECEQLFQVEFEPNSELQTIGKGAFSHSALARIQIPSHVTQICEHAFYECEQLSQVEFEPDSELKTIGEEAFSHSALTRIQIPAGAVELEDGWCSGTYHLIDVEVDRGNARYSSVGGKLIIGKSDIAKEDYDTLVFCARDSTEVNIPATIKIIGSYAFSYSAITSIQIPSHVTQICVGAFLSCRQLSQVEFEPNSELQTIGAYAFSDSALARIQIPSHVTQICENAFSSCKQLSRFEFEPNSELKTIGEEAFSYSALASIQIPSHVTQICEHAFYFCRQLSRFEFELNSELQTIGEEAFSYSVLASIQIPSHVTQICEHAFSSCQQLQIVEIDEESICVSTFRSSKIVMLPAHEKLF